MQLLDHMGSEYRSHENIFNLVRRIDVKKIGSGKEQTEVYIGKDASSNLSPHLFAIIEESKELLEDLNLLIGI